jgi:hypothetical protein
MTMLGSTSILSVNEK